MGRLGDHPSCLAHPGDHPSCADRLEIVLPATPSLTGIREISLVIRGTGEPAPVDLTLLAFDFIPFDSALDPHR
ncbi:MAG: hypothetical protein ACM3ST_16385 [Bdellovibrio bacteriovorus]